MERNARQYQAPRGRYVTIVSVSCASICLAVAGVIVGAAIQSGIYLMAAAAAIPVGVIFGVSRFAVRGYALTDNTLKVLRSGADKTFPLGDLRSARVEPRAMSGSRRVFGNGGFFSITGTFRSDRLGYYEAQVTDPERTVVLRFRDQTVVVSPHDPGGFVAAIGSGNESPDLEHRRTAAASEQPVGRRDADDRLPNTAMEPTART